MQTYDAKLGTRGVIVVGLTLVIAVLIALLLPAVQQAREAGMLGQQLARLASGRLKPTRERLHLVPGASIAEPQSPGGAADRSGLLNSAQKRRPVGVDRGAAFFEQGNARLQSSRRQPFDLSRSRAQG